MEATQMLDLSGMQPSDITPSVVPDPEIDGVGSPHIELLIRTGGGQDLFPIPYRSDQSVDDPLLRLLAE